MSLAKAVRVTFSTTEHCALDKFLKFLKTNVGPGGK